ncbi:sporulation membrane protein YtaF [Virgibacillus alimentarius]|uniref:sporulation membrane protein YtaF n=1 Tax=Virgibacillus alimentarius TaxID=698769 RepID=UPI0004939E64|nr:MULTISPECIES: sporulation membrane protein YtaF [Virgibacillus]HLR68296.1 sporulation membrane protein YtaF [Virgibacillus sp.]
MLFYTGLLFLVIAVSVDGFSVGVTYGMRNIRVPFFALSIIMICSGIVVSLSMTVGSILGSVISPHLADNIGGIILILLGCFSFLNIIRSKKESNPTESIPEATKKLHHFKTVLKTPDKADIDKSGTISAGEALILGAALALDAFGAGIAAAIIGYSPFLTSIFIALMSGAFLFCGLKIGMILSKNKAMQKMTFIPPLLLILIGTMNIY